MMKIYLQTVFLNVCDCHFPVGNDLLLVLCFQPVTMATAPPGPEDKPPPYTESAGVYGPPPASHVGGAYGPLPGATYPGHYPPQGQPPKPGGYPGYPGNRDHTMHALTVIILWMRPANERRRYIVTLSHCLGAHTKWSLLSQWEMMLHCNVVSHWLGAYTKWSLSRHHLGPAWIWFCSQTPWRGGFRLLVELHHCYGLVTKKHKWMFVMTTWIPAIMN